MKAKYLVSIVVLNITTSAVGSTFAPGNIAPFTPGNIVVANGGSVTEYKSNGTIVQSIVVPPADNRASVTVRDAVIDRFGRLHVMTSVPSGSTSNQNTWLSTLDPNTDRWEHHTRAGWSLTGVSYNGGIGVSDKYVFAPDMRTGSGGASEGIIRFPLDELIQPELFDDGSQSIWRTVKVGLDGFVYALTSSGDMKRYDPETMRELRHFQIFRNASITSLTVDAKSNIYTIDLDNVIHRFNPDGIWIESITIPGVGIDLEVFPNGTIIVGSTGATATITDTSFNSYSTIDTTYVQRHGDFDRNFIVFSAAIPEPSTLLLSIPALAALSTRRRAWHHVARSPSTPQMRATLPR